MSTSDELSELWAKIESELARRMLPMFPAPLDAGSGPSATWPSSGSISEFLDLAERLGAALIYATAFRFEPDDVDDLSLILGEDSSREAQRVTHDAQGHVGHIRAVVVGFAVAGVSHLWLAVANWHEDLEGRAAAEAATLVVVSEAASSVQEDEWARLLASNETFQRAKSNDSRQRIAFRLIPEFDDMSKSEEPGVRWAPGRICREAWDLYESEIKPEQERVLASEARALIDREGLSKIDAAARFGMGETRLRRILGQYPDD